MGYTRTFDMLSMTTVEAALRDHLRHNHFPPIIGGEDFALGAIKAVVAGEPDEPIVDAYTDRAGLAWEIVDAWHLMPFVEALAAEEEEDDD